MRRRDFIVIAVGAWLQAARAQQKAMPVIGYLSGTFPDPLSQLVAGFREGLNETAEPPHSQATEIYRLTHRSRRRSVSNLRMIPPRQTDLKRVGVRFAPRGGSRGRRHERAGAGADHKVTIIDEEMERLGLSSRRRSTARRMVLPAAFNAGQEAG